MDKLKHFKLARHMLSEEDVTILGKLTKFQAMECLKAFYGSQIPLAREILPQEAWLVAAGIVEYLLWLNPDLKEKIEAWWLFIEALIENSREINLPIILN